MTGTETSFYEQFAHTAGRWIEVAGIAVIIVGGLVATGLFLVQLLRGAGSKPVEVFSHYRGIWAEPSS